MQCQCLLGLAAVIPDEVAGAGLAEESADGIYRTAIVRCQSYEVPEIRHSATP